MSGRPIKRTLRAGGPGTSSEAAWSFESRIARPIQSGQKSS